MGYDSQHNIISKTQIHDSASSPNTTSAGAWTQVEKSSYNLDYQDYDTGSYTVDGMAYKQPHAPRKIIDQPVGTGTTTAANDPRIKTLDYDYDRNGNQTKVSKTICEAPVAEVTRENLWDEENRLRAIDLNPEATAIHPIAIYTYDAGGERIIKQNSTDLAVYENAEKVGTLTKSDFMLYPSGMVVARLAADGSGALSYTKHYFAGSQRVSSKIGTTTNLGKFLQDWTLQSTSNTPAPINPVLTSNDQLTKAETAVIKVYTAFGIALPTFTPANTAFLPVTAFTGTVTEDEQYFFHPDHLGSSNYITNFVGEVSQHMEYFAFGETFIEEHKNSNNSPYKFNGKELDEESGLYYYGARYYDPRISIWASVDPLADYNPVMNNEHYIDGEHNGGVENSFNFATYSYCYQNPVRYIDPNGKQVDVIDFIPFIGSGRDIYRGIRDGDMVTLGIGIVGLAIDIGTAGAGGSIVKAGIKTIVKQVAEVGAKAAVKHSVALIAEITLKQGYKLRNALKLVAKDGLQAHHLIPKELLKKSQVVRDAVAAGFDFNGIVNGLAVKAGHGPHKGYTESIMTAITNWQKSNPDYTLKQAKTFMEKLAAQAKEAIIKNGKDVKTTKL